jgi:hypothetical protein
MVKFGQDLGLENTKQLLFYPHFLFQFGNHDLDVRKKAVRPAYIYEIGLVCVF